MSELSKHALLLGVRVGLLTQVGLAPEWVLFPLHFTAWLMIGPLQGWHLHNIRPPKQTDVQDREK